MCPDRELLATCVLCIDHTFERRRTFSIDKAHVELSYDKTLIVGYTVGNGAVACLSTVTA